MVCWCSSRRRRIICGRGLTSTHSSTTSPSRRPSSASTTTVTGSVSTRTQPLSHWVFYAIPRQELRYGSLGRVSEPLFGHQFSSGLSQREGFPAHLRMCSGCPPMLLLFTHVAQLLSHARLTPDLFCPYEARRLAYGTERVFKL